MKRKAAEKAKERKEAKKREHERAREQMTRVVGALGLDSGGPSPLARAAKGLAAKRIKAAAAAAEDGGDEEGDQMSDGENDESDDDNQSEIYILKKKCDQQVLIIAAHESCIQGLQQQLDFMTTQNHSYQQRQVVLTSENELLKAKITDLQREVDVLDQLNDMTSQSATQENEQLKLEILQLKQAYGVMNQLDDLAMDSASAMSSAHEESDDE